MKNAADVEQVKKAGDREQYERNMEIADLRALLSTDAGRRIVWRYITICGVFQTSFTGNSHTFFNEGKRTVGLQILADVMDSDPDAYLKMLQESKEREAKNA